MSENTPYLDWNGNDWELGFSYQGQEYFEKWIVKHIRNLPRPLWMALGQKVEFLLNNKITIGEIRRIGLFMNYDGWKISYDIYAHGHARSVFNEKEIIRYI